MTLLLASLLQLAAAISAGCLARRRLDHRPVAIALAVATVASLLRAARWRWLVATDRFPPGPYHGWARVGFHVEQALWLAGPAALAWVALVALRPAWIAPSWLYKAHGAIAFSHIASGKECNPIKVLVGRWLIRVAEYDQGHLAVAAWALLCAACVLAYPALRDGPLRRLYLGVQLAALLVASVAVASWLRRRWPLRERPSPAELVVLLLVLCSLIDLAVGSWRYGLFGAAYEPTQAVLIAMYGAIALVQVVAIVRRNGPT
jgi:hypothetical protein